MLIARAFPLALTATLLAACDGGDTPADTDTDGAAAALPTEPEAWRTFLVDRGAWQPSYKEVSVTYTDAAGDPRTTVVSVWYPTTATSGAQAAYLGGAIAADGVWLEAAPADGTFPVMVFSHGHQGGIENLAAVIEHLVTHGWVVAAPTHTGNTTFDGSDRTTQIYWQRPQDVSAALDLVLQDDPIASHTDGRVFAFGHSFGGYTMWPLAGAAWDVDGIDDLCTTTDPSDSMCTSYSSADKDIFALGARDERILAGATLSGGDFDRFEAGGVASVEVPMMIVTGLLDGDNPEKAASYWGALPAGDHVLGTIAHGDHFTYTDVGGGTIGDPEHLEGDRGRSLTAVLVGAFAYREVVGGEGLDGLLDGSVEIDEDVTVEAWTTP